MSDSRKSGSDTPAPMEDGENSTIMEAIDDAWREVERVGEGGDGDE